MLDLVDSLLALLAESGDGRPCAVATIVGATGSVPRTLGTAMLVSPDGAVTGSLSGGCIEGAVVEAALEAIASGDSNRQFFGFSDDDAFAAGLTCGGTLEILVQPVFPEGWTGRRKEGDGKEGNDGGTHPLMSGALAGLAGLGAQHPAALIRRLDTVGFSESVRHSDSVRLSDTVRCGGDSKEASGSPVGRPAASLGSSGRRAERCAAVVVPEPQNVREQTLAAGLTALLGNSSLVQAAAAQLIPLLHAGWTGQLRLSADGVSCTDGTGTSGEPPSSGEPVTLFVESRLRAPRFLMFGANDFSAALLPAAQLLGYRVTLCDARPAFARQQRFQRADEVVTSWPDRYLRAEAAAGRVDGRSVICVLTHDPKFDIPLLTAALELDVAFLGAMGSRRSDAQRTEALLDAGVPPARLDRLHSPIGLDLGAVSPAEVAVSITAEILAVRANKQAFGPLRHGTGPIHGNGPIQGTDPFHGTGSIKTPAGMYDPAAVEDAPLTTAFVHAGGPLMFRI
ncbi:XdhC family protein [Arthrobacter sp. H14-L1]|uniref:XdhC family protein n=1 Tax=Arthrobacter sp. H14-L1 TaxID=2996697 RepID=UPI00227106D1|nr:XdhC/CoxI family protein [Arthrobacter sp. H14-L1]MCY0904996.1 XdhC family protein [Arthrobacter sp. H14-L1]